MKPRCLRLLDLLPEPCLDVLFDLVGLTFLEPPAPCLAGMFRESLIGATKSFYSSAIEATALLPVLP